MEQAARSVADQTDETRALPVYQLLRGRRDRAKGSFRRGVLSVSCLPRSRYPCAGSTGLPSHDLSTVESGRRSGLWLAIYSLERSRSPRATPKHTPHQLPTAPAEGIRGIYPLTSRRRLIC